MELERKSLSLEIKTIGDDGTFEGYAAAFGNTDSWNDIIETGAFKKSLFSHKKNGTMPKLLWQHDPSQPLGVWDSMKEDGAGLFARGVLLVGDVSRAREAHALLKAGAISGLSIGYRARDYVYDEATGIRTLKQVDLHEVSLVTFPANENAHVTAVKSAKPNTIREFEIFLRDVGGFSANEAKSIASRGFKARDEQNNSAEIAAIMQQITRKYK